MFFLLLVKILRQDIVSTLMTKSSVRKNPVAKNGPFNNFLPIKVFLLSFIYSWLTRQNKMAGRV